MTLAKWCIVQQLVTKGMSQSDAHDKTCEKFDYPSATNEFYNRLQNEHNARLGKGDIVSGGISHHKARDDWDICL